MKCVVLFTLLVIQKTSSDGSSSSSASATVEIQSRSEVSTGKNTTISNAKDKTDIKVPNTNIHEDIQRPCVLSDWQCVRKFLAKYSNCKPTYGPAPDPINIPYDKYFIPFVNLTLTPINTAVEGFKTAKITEFYVNKLTGNLVIAINVRDFMFTFPKIYFTYQRTAKEPIVLSDFAFVKYDSVTFTAILPGFPYLRLDLAEIHTFVHDGTPSYAIGPRAFNSTDPDVVSTIAQFVAAIPNAIQEQFAFESYLLVGIYIQRVLCDFGIDVYNNYLEYIDTGAFTLTPLRRRIQEMGNH